VSLRRFGVFREFDFFDTVVHRTILLVFADVELLGCRDVSPRFHLGYMRSWEVEDELIRLASYEANTVFVFNVHWEDRIRVCVYIKSHLHCGIVGEEQILGVAETTYAFLFTIGREVLEWERPGLCLRCTR
jgi:hypothetical protein